MTKSDHTSNLVSVVLPAYNTPEDFLRQTVEAVLAQSYTNWELLVIDDSTTAPVKKIVLSYNDERIKYFRNHENIGMANSRNQGICYAQGKYIAFLDHDDLYLPEKLAETLKLFESRKDAVLVYSDTIPFGCFQNRRIEIKKAEGKVFDAVMAQNPILSMSCSVADKAFLEKYDIKFNSDCVPCDDWDFHLQCALRGSIYCTAEPLVKYRYHENNLSSNAIKMYYAGINVINKYQNMLSDISQQSGLPRRMLQKSIDFIAFKHHYGLAFEYLKMHNYQTALKHLLRAFLYRPLKCIGKILCFIWKYALRKNAVFSL